jgi:hypothetical protein
VLASFALFALGQASGASKTQVADLNSGVAPGTPVPGPTSTVTGVSAAAPVVAPVVHAPGQPRRFIDGAAHALTSPFRALIHSNSLWAVKIASTLLALVAYGLGLGYLARWART